MKDTEVRHKDFSICMKKYQKKLNQECDTCCAVDELLGRL